MNIDPADKIAGIPILDVRELVRSARANPFIGDIDIAIELTRKVTDSQEWHRLSNEKVREASDNGRQFREFKDKIYWPELQVRLYLKNRSRALSIHSIDDQILDEAPQEVIYEATE